jgi:hypothetical protein
MAKLIYGVGVNDGRYPAKVKGKNLKVYDTLATFPRNDVTALNAQMKKPHLHRLSIQRELQKLLLFL